MANLVGEEETQVNEQDYKANFNARYPNLILKEKQAPKL